MSLRTVKGPESGARSELIMGNGGRFEGRKQRLLPLAIARNRCSARDHAVSRAWSSSSDRATPVALMIPERHWSGAVPW